MTSHPAMQAVQDALARQRAGTPSRYGLPFEEARALLRAERQPWLEDGPPCTGNARRSSYGGRSLQYQVYSPTLATPQRLLVYLHGGGWCVGGSDTHDNIVRRLAVGLGGVAWSVDYALAPEAPYPAGLLDCVAAIRLAAQENPDARLVVAGDSAGANLALDAARQLRDGGGLRIDSLLLFYGVYTDACDSRSMQAFGDGRYGLSRPAQQRYLDAYAGPAGLAALAPSFALHDSADLRGLPRCWLTVAELDILCDQSHELADKLRRAEVPVQLDEVAGVTHGFLSYGRLLPQVDDTLARATQWVRASLEDAAD